MEITRNILSIPTIPLLFLLMLLFAGSNLLIKYVAIKFYRDKKISKGFNEVVGTNYVILSSFYALLLAFVISDSLGSLSEVKKDADREGSIALNVYRQINCYSDSSIVKELKEQYLEYVKLVVEDEYPQMSLMLKSESTQKAFHRVFEMIEQLKPADPFNQEKANILLQSMNELSIYRSLRIFAGESEIPTFMYLTLLIGWLIISLFSALMNIENLSFHFLVNALIGCIIGLMFFLIIILDHPFVGSMRVEPMGYQIILNS